MVKECVFNFDEEDERATFRQRTTTYLPILSRVVWIQEKERSCDRQKDDHDMFIGSIVFFCNLNMDNNWIGEFNRIRKTDKFCL